MKQQEMAKNKKVIFVIQPQSMVDIITNSSSELFVFEGKEKQVIEEMIKDVYPDYLNEYEQLVSINDISDDNLYTYLIYKYWVYDIHDNLYLSKEFNIDPKILYSNWDNKNTDKYWYPQLSSEGCRLIKDKIDPNRQMYFLFSKYDNPEYEYQELLENIGTRYHLG
jgi:hypothetical protein